MTERCTAELCGASETLFKYFAKDCNRNGERGGREKREGVREEGGVGEGKKRGI